MLMSKVYSFFDLFFCSVRALFWHCVLSILAPKSYFALFCYSLVLPSHFLASSMRKTVVFFASRIRLLSHLSLVARFLPLVSVFGTKFKAEKTFFLEHYIMSAISDMVFPSALNFSIVFLSVTVQCTPRPILSKLTQKYYVNAHFATISYWIYYNCWNLPELTIKMISNLKISNNMHCVSIFFSNQNTVFTRSTNDKSDSFG